MHWVLTNNFIKFDNNIYLQIEGTAMGTPMAPTYAIIFMYAIERHHIQKSLFYLRYIDDIFAIFNSITHANEYLESINSFLPDRLKLEAVVCDQEGTFLDIHFQLINGNLSHQLFQKPHNTYAYIPTLSDHPRSMFKSFVLEELKRYYRNCSDFNTFTLNAALFKVRLQQRGYHSSVFNIAYTTLLNHLPINVSNVRRISLQDYPPPQAARHQSAAAILPAVLQKSKNVINRPILIINLPVLNYSINWRSFTDIPDELRDTLAFQLAFKSADIIISTCTPGNLGSLYISSTF